jgi:hypothetical protein
MPVRITKTLTCGLATILVVGTMDAAAARHRRHVRHVVSHHTVIRSTSPDSSFWSGIPVENGTPVIMKGYHPPKVGSGEPHRRADDTIEIPRGSGAYIPPPVPSPYSPNSPPAAALTQPTIQPYRPPHIETFGDRVTNGIHDYPLQKGIGNNPTDMQSFIRQRANQ